MSKRLATIGLGYVALMLALGWFWYRYQWQADFNFFNDSQEWAYLDKLGHLFITYWLASLLMSNEAQDKKYIACLIAFLMVSGIELADGFSVRYGFSSYDMLANATGALLAWFFPAGKSLSIFKFSFWPTSWASLRPELLGHHWAEQLIKDYNGQSYWISFPLPHLLCPRFFPPWLGISCGYGAGGMLYGQPGQNPAFFSEWMIAPDLLLSQLPVKDQRIRGFLIFADLVKLPFLLMVWRTDLGLSVQLWPA